jgi:dTDP-4-amino-4,6-dideoxygalactose transaminase
MQESGYISRMHQKAVMNALKKGRHDPTYLSSISGSGPVEKFEKAFANAVGGKYALALSSCTAALHTALMVYGIGPGDEVIVTPYTWGQSVAPVLFTGATAVFSDIDPKTLTIDPKSVRERVSDKTKAIMPVHIFGIPADMDGLISIANQYGLVIISDAAQAFGALSKSRKIGGLGDISCFSLGRGKAVSGGEGGVFVTDNKNVYEEAISITQHPLRAHREVLNSNSLFMDELGWNYRIHPMATVLAISELEMAIERILYRKKVIEKVNREIENISSIEAVQCYPKDTSAANGIALTVRCHREINKLKYLLKSEFLKNAKLLKGPVKVPIHLRTTFQYDHDCWVRPVKHYTHKKGSCEVAERRCQYQELQVIFRR